MTYIEDKLGRGIVDIIEKDSVEKKLKSGKILRIKHGVDPTGPNIHIGRAIQFWKLKKFQDLGHKIVFIIGDFTAKIGDASDKNSMRKPLTDQEIKVNIADYKEQIGRILDLNTVEIRYNSEWLSKLSIEELLKLSQKFTAQQLIHRRNFRERWDKGKEIGLHELLYPLFQGYDSVAVKSDIEIGGTDQLFNLLAGRRIQEIYNQKPQDVITSDMLPGLDGRKMSTSWGNVITIIDEPKEMFGKIMSMKDEQVMVYFELLTDIDLDEIEKIKNPRDQKARLGFELVKMYYSADEAKKASTEFDRIFKSKEIPENIEEIKISDNEINIVDLLANNNLVSSRSEAKRLIEQGGVKKIINNQKSIIKNIDEKIKVEDNLVLKIGKRKFVKIIK